jgi:hypothetical protein
MKKAIILLFVFTMWCMASVHAQEAPGSSGANKLLIAGHASVTAIMDSSTNNFTDAEFSAIFLYQLSDKLFLESELEIGTGEGSAELGLEHANLVWMIGKNIAFHAGRFVPHFGLYRGRLGEGFINRFADNPAGFGDGGIGTMEAVGFGFQGGIPLGSAKMNYDLWVSDGPQLLTDSANAGQFDYEAYGDNNKNKAIGGRIGFLPFSNSCLELGVSYETATKTGQYDPTGGDPLADVGVKMLAIDGNFYHSVDFLKSTLRLTGEYKKQDVDKAYYPSLGDSLVNGGSPTYGYFDNTANAYYVSASLRPSGSESTFLRNLELAYRYSSFTTPNGAAWAHYTVDPVAGTYTNKPVVRTAIALDYWLKWNCLLKLSYQTETDIAGKVFVQMYYGF